MTLIAVLFHTQMAQAQGIQDLHGTNPSKVQTNPKIDYNLLLNHPDFVESKSVLDRLIARQKRQYLKDDIAFTVVSVEFVATVGFYVYLAYAWVTGKNKDDAVKQALTRIEGNQRITLKNQSIFDERIKALENGERYKGPEGNYEWVDPKAVELEPVKVRSQGSNLRRLGMRGTGVIAFVLAAQALYAGFNKQSEKKMNVGLWDKDIAVLDVPQKNQLLFQLLQMVGGDPCELKEALADIEQVLEARE